MIRVARMNPQGVFRVEAPQPLVAPTIDDGPPATITPRALDVLATHGAHATFFQLGAVTVSELVAAGG